MDRAAQCNVSSPKEKEKCETKTGFSSVPRFFSPCICFLWPGQSVKSVICRPVRTQEAHSSSSFVLRRLFGGVYFYLFSHAVLVLVLTGPPPIQPRFLLEVNLSAPCSFLPRVRYSKGEPTEKKRKNPSTVTNIFDPKTTPIRKINEDEAGGGMCA